MAVMTAKMSVITQELYRRIKDNQAALGLEAVYLGDQTRIATTPACSVDSSIKTGALKGASRVVEYEIRVLVIIYSTLISSNQINTGTADAYVEIVEDFLNADPNLGGLIIHGFVESVESGYSAKTNSVTRASRMTYLALTQKRLPSSGG